MPPEFENVSQNDERSDNCSSGTKKKQPSKFSAKAFVDDILENGGKLPCDDTIEEFNREGIPNFYNADKFKRGQAFFQKYIFVLFFSKFLGLVVLLSSPSILAILKMTKKSGSTMTAYRRYVATMFHMNLWYETELTPDSKSMKSMKRVKAFHNSASLKSRNINCPPITQQDMVLTQFGFMGFCIARTEDVGIHGATNEELEGFVHFWKVVGSIMGIQDRFNICRDSLEETKEICEELINRAFRPLVAKKDKDFLEMTLYLTEGLWHVDPQLNFHVFLTILNELLKPKETLRNNNFTDNKKYFNLTFFEWLNYKFVCFVIYMMRYNICRAYLNFHHNLTMWIVHRYPFLAVYSFGYKNAMVSIDENHRKLH